MNNLILLTYIPLTVQKASVKHDLNKAQTKAPARLEQASAQLVAHTLFYFSKSQYLSFFQSQRKDSPEIW